MHKGGSTPLNFNGSPLTEKCYSLAKRHKIDDVLIFIHIKVKVSVWFRSYMRSWFLMNPQSCSAPPIRISLLLASRKSLLYFLLMLLWLWIIFWGNSTETHFLLLSYALKSPALSDHPSSAPLALMLNTFESHWQSIGLSCNQNSRFHFPFHVFCDEKCV